MASTDEPQTKMVQIKADDMGRIDRLADILEKQTGGSFSKGRVISRSLDVLEKEFGLDSQTPNQTVTPA